MKPQTKFKTFFSAKMKTQKFFINKNFRTYKKLFISNILTQINYISKDFNFLNMYEVDDKIVNNKEIV
jgi:hypothetical protein